METNSTVNAMSALIVRMDRWAMAAYFFACGPAMATLKRFARCKVAIYPDDHPPSHFHIEGRGFRLVVEIETMRVRAGESRSASDALEWAAENIDLLRLEWDRLNRRG